MQRWVVEKQKKGAAELEELLWCQSWVLAAGIPLGRLCCGWGRSGRAGVSLTVPLCPWCVPDCALCPCRSRPGAAPACRRSDPPSSWGPASLRRSLSAQQGGRNFHSGDQKRIPQFPSVPGRCPLPSLVSHGVPAAPPQPAPRCFPSLPFPSVL